MRVRFIVDYTVKDEEAKAYHKGTECDLPLASAMHFIKKSVAVEVQASESHEPETASVAPSETAVRPCGRPRTATTGD